MQAIAQRLKLHLVDYLIDKGKLKQQLSLFLADTTLPHVEHSGVIELSYRRTMGTLHVIGVDFQHRLGVHTGGIGSYKILIGFLTDGLLRIMTRSEEHTSELQSRQYLVCSLLLEKKKILKACIP